MENFMDLLLIYAPTLILGLFGIALLISGYKIFRIWLILVGAWIAYVGVEFASKFYPITHLEKWGAIFLIAIILGLLFYKAYKYSFALAGAGVAILAVYYYGHRLPLPNLPLKWIYIIAILAGGILAMLFAKMFIMICSSFCGAILIINIFDLFYNKNTLFNFDWENNFKMLNWPLAFNILPLILTGIGFIIQYTRSKKGRGIKL